MITLRGGTYRAKDYEAIAIFLQEAFANIIVPDCRGMDDLRELMHYCYNKCIELDNNESEV